MSLRGLRCLLVEDVVLLAETERRLLTALGLHVHIAGTLHDARQLLGAEPFDLVIADIGLPDGDGSDIIAMALSLVPPVAALMVSGIPDRGRDLELQAMGAVVLGKDALEHLPLAVAAAVRRLAAGRQRFAPPDGLAARPPLPPAPSDSHAPRGRCWANVAVDDYVLHHGLATRERQVFELSFQGFRDKEIARQLSISHSTVRTYWRGIAAKTGCDGQRDVMRHFARHLIRLKERLEQLSEKAASYPSVAIRQRHREPS